MGDFIGLIGLVFSLLVIIWLIVVGKKEIDSWIDSLSSPTNLNFYLLSFYSLVAAALGGVVWNILNRVNDLFHILGPSPYVGGMLEPHGIAAIIWPIATNAPVVITLVILGRKNDFKQIWYQLLLYGAFLSGITIGSKIFYDLSLEGKNGFRDYINSLNTVPPFFKEFLLVLLWSLFISSLGFLFVGLVNITVARKRDLRLLLKQTVLCTGFTTFSVVCFLLAFPDQASTARGILAGLALRMTLFFGLLVAHAVRLQPFVILRITWPREPQKPTELTP